MLDGLSLVVFIVATPWSRPAQDTAGASVEALVRHAQVVVEDSSDASERRLWEARLDSGADEPTALLALATLDRFAYRDSAAEGEYAEILAGGPTDIGAKSPDRLTSYALLGLGELRARQARLSESEPLLRRAAEAFVKAGDAAGAARALGVLGIAASRTAGLDSALTVMTGAMRIAPAGDDWLRSFLACNTILIRVRKADPSAAALARPEATAAERAGNPRAAAACLAALAQDYERRTSTDSALAAFREVEALQRRTRNLSALAATLQWEGYVWWLRGDFPAARSALEEGLELGRRTGALAAASWASIDLAQMALTFGDLPSSGRYARDATGMFTATGDRWGLLVSRMHEGTVALLNRALPAARADFEQVARDAADVSPSVAVHAHGRLAAVSLLEGDPGGAELELDTARRLAAELDMPEWREEDSYGRALLALQRGRLDEAGRRFEALRAIIPAEELLAQSELTVRLAEVQARSGDIDGAVVELERAGSLLDKWRASLRRRELRAAVVQARWLDWDRDLGFATVIDRIAGAGRVDTAFRLAEQRRARLLLERMIQRTVLAETSAGSLPSPPGPASSKEVPSVRSADAVRHVLPDSTAVMTFLTGRGGEPTTVFVLSRGGLSSVRVDPVDDHVLELSRFSGLIAAGVLPSDLARTLGRAFVEPAIALLPPGIHRLVVVPDGPLYLTPFDALEDGHGKPLLDRFEIAVAPSASVAASWWASPPRSPLPGALAFGDPVGPAHSGGLDTPELPRLPAAAAEARRVVGLAPEGRAFVGAEATEAELRAADLSEVGVLHFATHAEVDGWSLLGSALMLAPGGGQDGRVGVEELASLPVEANLVVLSACRSGAGAVLTGEGLEGLTEPLLEAGASSVVASLWEVDDRTTAPFMKLFYRELARGASVGSALRRAKRAARADGMSPAVWAAFTLTGDARVRTALRAPGSPAARLAMALLLALAAAGAYVGWWTTSRRNGERR